MINEPSRSDLKLMEQAIRKGWDIPEQLLSALPKVAGTMAINGTPRERIAAMRVLLAMKEQNEKTEPQTRPGQTINVGVQIDRNDANAGRNLASQVLARITAGAVSDGVPARIAAADSG